MPLNSFLILMNWPFKKKRVIYKALLLHITCLFIQTWDAGLAVTARAWAKHCVFEHNIHLKEARRMHPVFPSVGENIWTAYPPSSFSVMRAMESWINETKYYNYQINTCSKVCGHYTQVCYWSCPDSLLQCWCFHMFYICFTLHNV